MPIYEFVCKECSVLFERLCTYDESKSVTCKCGVPAVKQMSLVAKTPGGWNDGWTDGLDGYKKYDPGLGMHITSERHRDAELEKRGLVRESDLGEGWFEAEQSKRKAKVEKQEADAQAYSANLKKFNGDATRAMTETFTAKDILAGKHD